MIKIKVHQNLKFFLKKWHSGYLGYYTYFYLQQLVPYKVLFIAFHPHTISEHAQIPVTSSVNREANLASDFHLDLLLWTLKLSDMQVSCEKLW